MSDFERHGDLKPLDMRLCIALWLVLAAASWGIVYTVVTGDIPLID